MIYANDYARRTRTEKRIKDLVTYCRSPKYRDDVIERFADKWGVGETTISHAIQTALREGVLEYVRGMYKAVE